MLKDCIPRSFAEMVQMRELFDAEQPELDQAENEVELWIRELYIMTAEKTLELWEKDYALQPDPSLTLQQRRNRLLEKKRGRVLPKIATLEATIQSLSGAEHITIEEADRIYTLITDQGTIEGGFDAAISWFRKVKPSHFDFTVDCRADAKGSKFITDSAMHVGMNAVDDRTDFCIDVSSGGFMELLTDDEGNILTGESHADRKELVYGGIT